jgi:hypothetical protein
MTVKFAKTHWPIPGTSGFDSAYNVFIDGEKIGKVGNLAGNWEYETIDGLGGRANTRKEAVAKMQAAHEGEQKFEAPKGKEWTLDGITYYEVCHGPSTIAQISHIQRGVVKNHDGWWYPVVNGEIIDWDGCQFSGGAIGFLPRM